VRSRAAILLWLGLTGCVPSPVVPPGPRFAPAELRRIVTVVHVAVARGAFSERERELLTAAYEGALLEGLNARALLVLDFQRAEARLPDRAEVLARARALGADHVLLVAARVTREDGRFCAAEGRPFRAPVTRWSQALTVVRVDDGTPRLHEADPALGATDVEPDCVEPRQSRRRSGAEAAAAAVSRLLARLLEP
jgi:hypothetical protein